MNSDRVFTYVNLDKMHRIYIIICKDSKESHMSQVPYISEQLYAKMSADVLRQIIHMKIMLDIKENNIDKIYNMQELRINITQLIIFTRGTKIPDFSFLPNLAGLFVDVNKFVNIDRSEREKNIIIPAECKLYLIYEDEHKDMAILLQQKIKRSK